MHFVFRFLKYFHGEHFSTVTVKIYLLNYTYVNRKYIFCFISSKFREQEVSYLYFDSKLKWKLSSSTADCRLDWLDPQPTPPTYAQLSR